MAGQTVSGLIAEFIEPEELLQATQQAWQAGYRCVEAYSPFPVEGVAEALDFRTDWLPRLVLIGGFLGAGGGYLLQYWVHVLQYPMNVGGRPLNSWPLFMPVTFECTILAASLFCILGMLALNGLPRPHHPLFDVEGFERASTDRFFLYIQQRDPQFDYQRTFDFLQGLSPHRVAEVPPPP